MNYTAEEKAKEAEREVAMRERVYSRWVADKRMSQADGEVEHSFGPELTIELRGGVHLVTLDRPASLNAVDIPMQPRPIADTPGPAEPSVLVIMTIASPDTSIS